MEQCESAAALLESVREQEVQFEQLTRALEEERRWVGLPATSPSTLGRPLPHTQNGRLGDADIERLKLTDAYINGTQYRMVDPAHGALDESYTPEDDSQEVHSVFSEEGTTRRQDNGVSDMTYKPITRTVLPSDSMSIDGGLSVSGMGPYSATLDRPYRQPVAGDYPTATVPRNYPYGPVPGYDDYRGGPPSEAYTSLSRGSHMDDRYRPVDGYRTLDSGYRAPSRQQLDPYAAQPQVSRGMRALGSAMEMRYGHGHYGLEDDQRSVGYDDYGMGPPPMHPGGYGTMPRLGPGPGGMDRRRLSCEDTLDGDMGGVDPYAWAVPMTMERGSMASLDSTLRKAPPGSWRQPELPEVIAMLSYRLDPVKTNAAAFLQHLTFKNDKVKSEVRRLKGIPALVSLLDHPSKDVHHSACGALKNISYGRDHDNKIAIKNCDGVPGLVRLLRKTHDQDLTDTITGTLWNLSSHDSVKMEIVDHAMHALADEVVVPHSGWERGSNGAGEESCKPRHLEWETALTNTAGCLRNVSSERSEARRKLRECTGLVDSLMYIVQSQINRKDVDNKLVENCVCLLRNLSYHVHREVPGCERYVEALPLNQGPVPANKGGCFGSRKGKGQWKKDGDDGSGDQVDIPKRTTPAKGYELLFQPEVVRVYTSLLRESKNPSVLEAAAGAIQNLCAGRWTYGRYIRATLLAHVNDRVVRAMSGALRNLAIDNRNCELLGLHAVPHLVANLPGGQSQSGRALSEETVVSVLSTLAEVLGNSLEAAKTLRASQGIERLVLINKDGKRSEREVRGAGQVLQLVWAHKELRRPLEKDGWKKTDFMVTLNHNTAATTNGPNTRVNGTYEDSTTPLLDRGRFAEKSFSDLSNFTFTDIFYFFPHSLLFSFSLSLVVSQRGVYGGRKGSLPLLDSYDG
uniref:Catenin delta 1 n=1 Tax=Labrus bergylta TaxID=56723 RepID=A0A3Q3F2C1_9LABR